MVTSQCPATEEGEAGVYRLIEDCLPPLSSSPGKKISPAKRKQYYINRAIRNSELTPKAKGRKSLRRLENTRYLMTLLEREECATDEVDTRASATPSIFTEACNNETYIEIWNDFMNRTGEEQEKVLIYLEQEVRQSPRERANKTRDKRTDHPAHTPEECYQRINRSLRGTLRKRQIPMGTLECLEEEMLSFFSITPESVYITMMDNSYQRLLLHAVCQYMDLVSASYDFKGKRQIRVMNRHTVFCPPELLLSSYLQMKC